MSEQDFFQGKIDDLLRREKRGEPMVFSSFLTAEEAAVASGICRKAGAPHLLYGGYPFAERRMLAVSSVDAETLKMCFPIVLLKLCGGDLSAISNRDVLGAMMATGIRRDVLGDVIVRDGQALVFVSEHIKDFLIQNVTSVGRQNIQLAEAPLSYEIPEPRFEHLRLTVASLRLDAVVGGLVHLSREQASRLIEEKNGFGQPRNGWQKNKGNSCRGLPYRSRVRQMDRRRMRGADQKRKGDPAMQKVYLGGSKDVEPGCNSKQGI